MESMATMVRISSVHLYVSEQIRVLLIIGSTGNSAIRRPGGSRGKGRMRRGEG